MQVKFSRSKRVAGFFGGKIHYILTARMAPTAEELELIDKHNLWKETIGITTDRPIAGNPNVLLTLRTLYEGCDISMLYAQCVPVSEQAIIEGLKEIVARAGRLDSFGGDERIVEI